MVVCLHSTLNAFEFGVAEQPSMLVMLMSLVVASLFRLFYSHFADLIFVKIAAQDF